LATLPSKVNLATPFMQIKNKNLNILVERTKECRPTGYSACAFTFGARSIIDLIYKTEAFLAVPFVHAFGLKVITASEKGDHS
jgi:hypothetical protein